MDFLKKIKNKIITDSPFYQKEAYMDTKKTSKLMWNRNRIAFTRLIGPGFHMEAEKSLFDKRFKLPMFRHFRYFGPRGELFIYFLVFCGVNRQIKNNIQRENNIDSLLNDRNTYFKVNLPNDLKSLQ
jgi:hypothetical protein